MNIMRKTLALIAVAIALIAVVPAPRAEAANLANLTNTTLSAAVDGKSSATRVTLASNSGVVVASGSVPNTVIIADDEAMMVQSQVGASTSTIYNVVRGYRGTLVMSHNSGAVVIVASLGNPQQVFDNFLRGSCTASLVPFNPRIVISSGFKTTKMIFYQTCTGPLNAQIWREATSLGDTTAINTAFCTVPIGSVAYASFGASTATVAGTEFVSSIYVPQTTLFTGLRVLQGTVGTDKWIATLRDAAGNLLANSATAGQSTVGSNTIVAWNFTGTIIVPGPARYFVGLQSNGTADTMSLQAASTFVDTLTTSATGTFGTITSTFTVPTTFTANKGPIACLF